MASHSSNESSPQATSTVDPYEALGFVPNPDGSVTRKLEYPFSPATQNPDQSRPILTKDVPLNESKNTWVRIYLPQEVSLSRKQPLIFYYHGGGFVVCSAGSTMFQEFLTTLSFKTKSVIVSVEYRLAPEHRLPAAYDDCVEALHWIRTMQDEWLTRFADLSNCYLMGISAGSNIAYQVGLQVVSAVQELKPLEIKGLILQQPFFGGVKRTGSEFKCNSSHVFTLGMSDLMWELSLPIGADRDHEYCNPTVCDKSVLWDEIKRLGWKVMVTGCDGDLLIDHQLKFVEALKERGVGVMCRFCEGFYHGYELNDSSRAEELCDAIMKFITSTSISSISS